MTWCEWTVVIAAVALIAYLTRLAPAHLLVFFDSAFWVVVYTIGVLFILPLYVLLRLIDLALGGPRFRRYLRASRQRVLEDWSR